MLLLKHYDIQKVLRSYNENKLIIFAYQKAPIRTFQTVFFYYKINFVN